MITTVLPPITRSSPGLALIPDQLVRTPITVVAPAATDAVPAE
jgi:hypothetical protein